jgi:Tfp pilus assembly protein PilF
MKFSLRLMENLNINTGKVYSLISLNLVSIFTGSTHMNHSRLEQLFAFLKEDPADPFNLYAIATEYLKTDLSQALAYFEQLLQEHPDYVPAYYHAASVYVQVNKPEKARETYEKGLVVSLQQNNRHAHRELQSAYRQFLDELEE